MGLGEGIRNIIGRRGRLIGSFNIFFEFFDFFFWAAGLVPSDSPSNSMHFALLDGSVARFSCSTSRFMYFYVFQCIFMYLYVFLMIFMYF